MANNTFSFTKKSEFGQLGRTGVIHTPHGEIQTPAFIPVGTKATVKTLTNDQIINTGAQAVLANTYHLYLRPGEDVVKNAGGLHDFMNYQGPIFTDSGGFQVFSLGAAFGSGIGKVADENNTSTKKEVKQSLMKIDDEGVKFRSHLDGSKHHLNAEKSMQIQSDLGADIIFAFDECTAPTASYEYQKIALKRTHEWAQRSLGAHNSIREPIEQKQALYAVVQGARYEDLRKESARTLAEMDFDGYGIGGAFNKLDLAKAVQWVTEELPDEKPRHLLGIGTPEDILAAVAVGIDTFDCVTPTRNARNGSLYTYNGRLNIAREEFRLDLKPIEDNCECFTCKNHTRSYLRHLFKADEMTAFSLLTIHNLWFFARLMTDIRNTMERGDFNDFTADFLKNYS